MVSLLACQLLKWISLFQSRMADAMCILLELCMLLHADMPHRDPFCDCDSRQMCSSHSHSICFFLHLVPYRRSNADRAFLQVCITTAATAANAMQMYLVYNLEPGSGMLHSKICN